jgi:hypothetical protein
MSLLIRRIVFVIATFMLPMQSWAGALASACVMTTSADAPAHCCKDLHSDAQHDAIPTSSIDKHSTGQLSTDKPLTDKSLTGKQAAKECLSGADCHCSALYQPITPFALIAPIKISATAFIDTNTLFVAITPPPLWRPPITV